MNDIITTRLTGNLNKDLEIVAKTEHLDKSTVMRRLLSNAISEWKKEYSIKMYTSGKYSTEQAARFAEISLWSFFDLLKEKKIPLTYDVEEFERDVKNTKWKKQ